LTSALARHLPVDPGPQQDEPVTDRDRYRDNDDVRAPLEDRAETDPDTKSEARGDAREAVGNTARDTAANPTGPEGNDRTRSRPSEDDFDRDLERDAHVSEPED
jgi:hypothetical protein